MDNLLTILQWAFPAGLSIWQLLLIRTYRRLNKAKAVRDTQEVWKQIAESNEETLLEQNEKIRRLREAVAKLESVLFRLPSCKYYVHCPARDVVQEYKTKFHHTNRRNAPGQPKGNRLPRDNPGFDSGIDATHSEPP